MERIRFAARIYARDGAEYTAGGYPTLRQAIQSAQAECEADHKKQTELEHLKRVLRMKSYR
jgi:hypothetical protein